MQSPDHANEVNTLFACGDITVLRGDCLKLLRTMPKHCTVITDCPWTIRTVADAETALVNLHYDYSDALVFTNPVPGYIYHGQIVAVPDLAVAATEYHRHQRPLTEVMELVAMTEGQGTVLDCYSGSGTTLLAAHQLGRASIGIELDYDAFMRCCHRIENFMDMGV